jgi:SAM-dependent methyltransferase
MKYFYEILYRYFRAPWDIGPRQELVDLVERRSIQPCRAIDLGCGTGANAIFLAEHGLEVTAVDFSVAAIEKATQRARAASVQVNFLVDDLTCLSRVTGPFDFLVDYGVLDDLGDQQREAYLENILPLAAPGSRYLLWGFEYPMRWWERLIPFNPAPFALGEVEQRFSRYFRIEKLAGEINWSSWPPGYGVYLMERKDC